MAQRKGESITLRCARCSWSTELPMGATFASTAVPCAHCGALLYWHRCETCGLCYVGDAVPRCPSCDDASLDELDYV